MNDKVVNDHEAASESFFPEYAPHASQLPQALTIAAGYDHVGSGTGAFKNGTHIDDPNPTLSGKAQPYQVIELYDSLLGFLGKGIADAQGNWSFVVPDGLRNGEHSITAVSGGQTSEPFVFTLDSAVEPLVIEQGYDDAGGQVGVIHNGDRTDDDAPRLSGTADPDRIITFYDSQAGYLGQATADANGHWSFDVPPGMLVAGEHAITGYSGSLASEPFVFVVDGATNPPTPMPLVIEQGYDDVGTAGAFHSGDHTDDATPRLSGTATAGAVVNLYDSLQGYLGQAIANDKGEWFFDASFAVIGAHAITAVSGEQASEPFVLVLDEVAPPPVPVPLVIEQGYDDVGTAGAFHSGDHTDDATPRLSGTAAVGAVIDLYDSQQGYLGQATANEKGEWFFDASFAALGAHTITAVSGDQTSNVFGFTLDAPVTPPTPQPVVITQGYDDVGDTGVFTDNGHTDDIYPRLSGTAGANAVVDVWEGVNYLGQTTADKDGHWFLDVTTPMMIGPHEILATDGVSTSDFFHFTVDSPVTPPTPMLPTIDHAYDNSGSELVEIPDRGKTDDNTPFLHGKADPGVEVSLYIRPLGETYTVHADDRGEWTFQMPALEVGSAAVVASVDGHIGGTYSFVVYPPGSLSPESTSVAEQGHGVVGTEMSGGDAAAQVSEPAGHAAVALPTMPVIQHVYDNSHGDLADVACYGRTTDSTPLLTGTADPGAIVSFYIYPLGHVGQAQANEKGEWTFEMPQELEAGRYSVLATVEGGVGVAPFVFDVAGHVAGAHLPEGLSGNDVLSTGESELFAAEHPQDAGHLELRDIDMAGVAVEGTAVQIANVSLHDVASLNGNLVLPHEHASTVM